MAAEIESPVSNTRKWGADFPKVLNVLNKHDMGKVTKKRIKVMYLIRAKQWTKFRKIDKRHVTFINFSKFGPLFCPY